MDAYSDQFEIQFNGPTKWFYQIRTKKSSGLQEINLHIEGVDQAHNPGDIRMVTDGVTTWMIGEGTDNECVQYPNNLGLDPTFIYPETFIPFQDLSSIVSYLGEEQKSGKASMHFSGKNFLIGGWKDASVDLWQDKLSKTLNQLTMNASGEDPFFGTGTGMVNAHYVVDATAPTAIEPVAGCEINVPLPENAQTFIRLPGIASFESPSGTDEIIAFYLAILSEQNWAEKEAPAESEKAIMLSYQRDAEEVQIKIERTEAGGSKITLIFQQGQ